MGWLFIVILACGFWSCKYEGDHLLAAFIGWACVGFGAAWHIVQYLSKFIVLPL